MKMISVDDYVHDDLVKISQHRKDNRQLVKTIKDIVAELVAKEVRRIT